MEVVFSRQAELDLEEIPDAIAIDSTPAAIRFVQAIRGFCTRIGSTPLAYPALPELDLDILCCVHQRYLILSQTGALSLLVVCILHGSRDLLALFSIDQDWVGLTYALLCCGMRSFLGV